jgi:hypothetical protein
VYSRELPAGGPVLSPVICQREVCRPACNRPVGALWFPSGSLLSPCGFLIPSLLHPCADPPVRRNKQLIVNGQECDSANILSRGRVWSRIGRRGYGSAATPSSKMSRAYRILHLLVIPTAQAGVRARDRNNSGHVRMNGAEVLCCTDSQELHTNRRASP